MITLTDCEYRSFTKRIQELEGALKEINQRAATPKRWTETRARFDFAVIRNIATEALKEGGTT